MIQQEDLRSLYTAFIAVDRESQFEEHSQDSNFEPIGDRTLSQPDNSLSGGDNSAQRTYPTNQFSEFLTP